MAGAARVLDAATLSASDILSALSSEMALHHGGGLAIEDSGLPSLENGPHRRRGRNDTPPPRNRRNGGASQAERSSSSAGPAVSEHSYNTTDEWLQYSRNRGALVEELYKRPNWTHFIRAVTAKDDLRKKLLKMSAEDLADILVKLDHQ
jgi:uncharacterized protein YjiS (DUF1127 family)